MSSSFEKFFLTTTDSNDNWFYRLDKVQQTRIINSDWNYRSQKMMKLSFQEALKWRKDKDIVNNCLFVGETGSGKTNPVYRIARYLAKIYKIDNERIFLTIGKHLDINLHRTLDEFGENSIIIVEEAEECINKYRGHSNQGLNFANTLDQIRKFNVHFIFVAPNWSSLNKDILKNSVNWIFTMVYNDHKNKRVLAQIEYNCWDKGLENYNYELHSQFWFNWLPKSIFEKYDKSIRNYGKSEASKFDYHDNKKSYLKSQKKERKDNKKLEFAKLKAECDKELKENGKSLSDTTHDKVVKRIKRKWAIELFIEGANASQVGSLLKVGASTASGWEIEAVQERVKREEGKRESEEKR